ncbi:MAG TPA: cupin domain-containing protein [Micromonosporaceae bacterium]|jgi:mannose-6-phosphate isomerase-like protein (cupin superfamily)|nr:cupin domain-containing protein [Micromonosporaceae bacterium]
MRIISGAGGYTTPDPGTPNHFAEQLRVPDLSVGTYSIPAGGDDDQTPHSEDEIYLVTAGRARLVTGDGEGFVGPGDVIYVPSGEAHRFVDITEDLALLVIFAPAYRSRAT